MVETIGKTDNVEIVLITQSSGSMAPFVHTISHLDPRASLAQSLAHALVSAQPNATAERTAEDACDIAEALWSQFGRRGWILKAPSLEHLEKMQEMMRNENVTQAS